LSLYRNSVATGNAFYISKNKKYEGIDYLNKTISAKTELTQSATNTAANSETTTQSDTPITMLKRIGSTTYQISVYPSKTSKETMSDKITRMIKNEKLGKAAGE